MSDGISAERASGSHASAVPRDTVHAAGRVQRATAALYERLGPRVFLLTIAVGIVGALVGGEVQSIWLFRYVHASSSDALLLRVAGAVALAVAGALITVRSRDLIGAVRSWPGTGRSPERAADVWQVMVRAPYTAMKRATAVAVAVLVPFSILIVVVLKEPALSAIPIGVAILAYIFAGVLLIGFAMELVLRPMLAEVASQLPAGFQPSTHTWQLRTKVLAPLPVVAFLAALSAGAFSDLVARGPLRLTLAEAIALATTAIAGLTFLVITRSLLDPLNDLLAGTQRVQDDDLATVVPVVTADDLGALASSFNRMLDDLSRSREELRQHADQLRASRARIVAAAAEERRRVERDLHDGAQQRMVLLGLKLAQVERMIRDVPEAASLLAESRADLTAALAELRDLAHGIYPSILENDGLRGALPEAAQRAAITTRVELDGTGRYGADLEAAVYFCCLEALQNAAKHAGEGATATIRVTEQDATLRFEVADDGVGFEANGAISSSGIQNMTDRIGALGGTLHVWTASGAGTRIKGAIPLRGQDG